MNDAILPTVNMSCEALLRPVWTHAKDGTDKLPINSKSIPGRVTEDSVVLVIGVGDVFIAQVCTLESQDETLLKVPSVRRMSLR